MPLDILISVHCTANRKLTQLRENAHKNKCVSKTRIRQTGKGVQIKLCATSSALFSRESTVSALQLKSVSKKPKMVHSKSH